MSRVGTVRAVSVFVLSERCRFHICTLTQQKTSSDRDRRPVRFVRLALKDFQAKWQVLCGCNTALSTEHKTRLVLQAVWRLSVGQINFCHLPRIEPRSLARPPSGLVTTQTELPHLRITSMPHQIYYGVTYWRVLSHPRHRWEAFGRKWQEGLRCWRNRTRGSELGSSRSG